MAKCASGDLIALEAMYRSPCLLNLYHRASHLPQSDECNNYPIEYHTQVTNDSLAFAEVIDFLEEARGSESTTPVLKTF